MSPTPKRGILEIAAYTPGKSRAAGVAQPIKLSANENPLGCSPVAREAYMAASNGLHLYPDAKTSRLRAAIAAKFNLEPERLIFGAGSDEIFAVAAQTYLGPGDNAVQPEFGFAAWSIAVRATGAEMRSAAEPSYVADVDTLLAAVDERTRIVFIANPANPTGTWLPFSEIERLHDRLPRDVLLVLDGAYAECAYGLEGYSDGLEWSRDKQNVIVTRTFSKIYGLASLRIGWAYAAPAVADAMNRIRLPFSVPSAGEAAAVAALADDAFVGRSVALVVQGRRELTNALRHMGLTTLDTAANFVTVRFDDAAKVETELARRGLLVRHLANYNLPDWLRITVGMPTDQARLIEALKEIVSAAPRQ